MAKTNVQAFVIPEELIDMVAQWASRFELTAVLMRFFPEYVSTVGEEGTAFPSLLNEFGLPSRICLGNTRPEMRVASPYEFMLKNPDWMAIDVGALNRDGLRESVLGANPADAIADKVWKAIAAEFRKRTNAGLWCYNPKTGAKAFYRTLRYSEKVAALTREGLKLIPTGVGNLCQIEDPASA